MSEGNLCRASERAEGDYMRDIRAEWLTTDSRANRPWHALCAAVMMAVALGKHEFGHI